MDALPGIRQSALLRAAAEVPVTAELAGRVVAINWVFARGQRIAAAEAERDRLAQERERIGAPAARNVSTQASLATTTANLAAAEATLGQRQAALTAAELVRDQAVLRAPFDAVVTQEALSVGQFVQPGTEVGRLVASNSAELLVGLNAEQLGAIGADGALAGRAVTVHATDGSGAERPGRIERVALTSEAATQTVGVLVRVDDPLDPTRDIFRIGALYDVVIPLPDREGVLVSVPVSAVQTGDRIWTVRDGALELVAADLDRRDGDAVILRSDTLDPGDRVVTTRLPNAVSGLRVRVAGGEVAGLGE